uniref:C2H2-type domain-containing protein n=1 Tax=Setaria digitata TaxID=48799 RepID=A0A915PR52_9BILA
MSNWSSPATTEATFLREWYSSLRLHTASVMKQESRNQVSASAPSMISSNDAGSGSKLLTPCLLSHLAIPVFSQPSIELPKSALAKRISADIYNLAPRFNTHLQNDLCRIPVDNQALPLLSNASNYEGCSARNKKKTKNCKVDAFSIESLLGRTNSSTIPINTKLSESSFAKIELSSSSIQNCEGGTTRYTLDALQSTDGRSKRKKGFSSDREISTVDLSSRLICNQCGKSYATTSNLSRHKQTHRPLDSPYAKQCPNCDRVYVSMPALSMHMLTHKAAHKCTQCGKTFSRPWLLQGHMRAHTGIKKYECPGCGKLFALKSYLNKHIELVCPIQRPLRSRHVASS